MSLIEQLRDDAEEVGLTGGDWNDIANRIIEAVERITELQARLDALEEDYGLLLARNNVLRARLDAVEDFCERAVNAYPDLRDEYEALEQKE